ncbi:MAG: autotransporter outer membrane beta-barrel domain-containing protein, partial [Desulfobacterales bacterium]|nr:autotransporter outer membrane beta-barrel domain-containing protein [Desulfobacterales bacterium]
GSLENSGRIYMDIHRPNGAMLTWIYGIRAEGSSLTNSGEVDITARGSLNLADTRVTGIEFTGNNLTNTGVLTISATGGSSALNGFSDARAKGIYTQGNLINTRDITVTAVGGIETTPNISGDAYAHGIETDGNLTLDSRGVIRVSAQRSPGYTGGLVEAQQVKVTSGTTTIVGYAMELAPQVDFTATYQGAIHVNSGASAQFSNAVLYLSVPANFDAQEYYDIPMLVQGAATADQFASIGGLPPEYKAKLINGNGVVPQQIQFLFSPEDSVALIGSQVMNEFDGQLHGIIGDQIMTPVLFDLLQSQGTTPLGLVSLASPMDSKPFMASLGPVPPMIPELTPDRNTLFFTPVLLSSDRDHPTRGYDALRHGFLAGFTREITADEFYLGLHGGRSETEIDYRGQGFEQRMDQVESYFLGAHALYVHDERWFGSAMASSFFSSTDYADHTPTNRERAHYDAMGIRGDFTLGRRWQLGNHHLIPEVGISTLWNQRDEFTTTNPDHIPVTYGAMEEWDFYGRLGLRWLTTLTTDSGLKITPHVGLGLTQMLTDGEFSNTLTANDLPKTVTDGVDKTQARLDLSLSLGVEPYQVMVGYSGSWSREVRNDFLWLRLGISF